MSKLIAVLVGMASLVLRADTPAPPVSAPTTAPTTQPDTLLSPGTVAPDFTLRDRDGSQLQLQNLRGKVVLLEFWATWCGPSKASVPRVKRLHDTLSAQGLEVISVVTTDNQEGYESFLSKHPNYSWHIAFDPADEKQSIGYQHYTISGFPSFFVIDRSGKIVFSGKGPLDDRARTLRLLSALEAEGIK